GGIALNRQFVVAMVVLAFMTIPFLGFPQEVGGSPLEKEEVDMADGLSIVEDGQPRAVIIIQSSGHQDVVTAAHSLVTYVRQSTGARLPLMTEARFRATRSDDEDQIRIYVGISAPEAEE